MLRNKKTTLFAMSLLSSLSLAAYAQPASQHMVVAPQCLIKETNANLHVLSKANGFVLIQTNDAGIDALVDAKAEKRKVPCGGFMDVSEEWKNFTPKSLSKDNKAKQFLIQQTKPVSVAPGLSKAKYAIKHEKEVNQVLSQMNPQSMWDNLTTLTNFNDRYANSDTGVAAAKKIMEIIGGYNKRNDVTIYTVATGEKYKQPSVVVKMGNGTGPGIVIGAHMDTLSASFSKKPGADDDGSGSVTVLEVARTLLASNMQFQKPIYFIWYSAEEMGLVGSSYVVADFKKKNIPVDAVIHFDMTGYAYKNDPTMWLISDHTNKELTSYVEKLITTYVKQPVKYTACGYACSDHASWTKGGFASAMPFESSFNNDNPNIHSAQDTMDKLSLAHMTDYMKLGAAFVVELAGPIA